jgi:6-phosphogluconolactonase
METRWHVAENDADWLFQAVEFITRAEAEALSARGEFHIVLAGGGTPRRLYRALAEEGHDWPRWHVWYGDERCLPADHPERNSKMAADAWLDRVPIPPANIHPIPAELGPETAASAYSDALSGVDMFDLVLLGLGEDGHTASLFPGHEWGWGEAAPAAIAVFDASKAPPERVSLSAHRLGKSRKVLFLATGQGKRGAAADWRKGVPIPASAVMAAGGVDVLLDRSANGEGT